MPDYTLIDPATQAKVRITADRPPTQEEAAELIASALNKTEVQHQPPDDAPKDVTWFDEAEYAWDSTNADYENWGLALEAKIPMGEFRIDREGFSYDSPEKLYGAEFMAMSYPERKEFLRSRRSQSVLEEHQDVIEFQESQGKSASADIIGSFAKAIATPTSGLVFGKGLLGAMTTGAGLGVETELSEQIVQDDINVVDLTKAAAIGAGGGALANKVENLARTVAAKRRSAKHNEKINKASENINREVLSARANGLSPQDSLKQAQDVLGISDADMLEVSAQNKVRLPSGEAIEKFKINQENAIPSVQKTAGLIERTVTPISTRVREISPSVFGRLRKLEMKTHEKTAGYTERASNFLQRSTKLKKKKDNNYLAFERALMNNQRDEAKQISEEHFPELTETVDEVGGILDDIYRDLTDSGIDVDYAVDYFPRKIKNMKGLMETLGRELETDLKRYLDRQAKKKGLSGRAELDESDTDLLTNQFLSGKAQHEKGISIAKQRRIEELDEAMQEHYYSAPESLMFYINKAVKESEKRKFFGEGSVAKKDGTLDTDQSVGALVAAEKNLSDEQIGDLKAILSARFDQGEQTSSGFIAGLRNLQTASLLGQFDSAAIQLGDIGTSAYLNGVINTIKGLGGAARNKGITSAEELGVIRNIAADIEANGIGANIVDFTLKASGFRWIDRLGKDTVINAAYRKNIKLANKNPEKIAENWSDVFGAETKSLIDDLKAGRNTENVRLLLFNELSDAQPISLSEMPENYLNAPNGRIFYALKSFALRQLDLVKRTAIDEMRSGNYLKGFTNLTKYAAYMGMSGGSVATVRDWMQTKEFRPEKMPDKAFETLMSIMFLNEYSREKYLKTGNIGDFAVELLAPATPQIFSTIAKAGIEAATADEEADPEKFNKVIKDIPVAGKASYYWLFGGAERKLERERKKEIKEARLRAGIN